MKFYIIYSISCQRVESIKQFQPPNVKSWNCTEDDSCYDYDYLGGDYINGKHRKYVNTLTKAQFKRFVDRCQLVAQDVETMGSLTEFGLIPAISFDSEMDWAIINAYVTPIPENHKGEELQRSDKHWDWIKKAILDLHGTNETYYSQTYKNYHSKK